MAGGGTRLPKATLRQAGRLGVLVRDAVPRRIEVETAPPFLNSLRLSHEP